MLVSITNASARLAALGDKVDRSTLSRYLKQHAEALPIRREGKVGLVDWDALVAHRRENIRIAGQIGSSEAGGGSSVLARIDGAARKVNADAEMRELDLAARRGELVPRDEVERAAREAVAMMTSAFERAIDTSSAAAALKYGWEERVVRQVLKSFMKDGQSAFHRELLARVDSLGAGADSRACEVSDRDLAALP